MLPNVVHGDSAHCILPTSATTKAVRHETVEEIGYFIHGQDEVYRKEIKFIGEEQVIYEEVVPIKSGTNLTIPFGVHFQFRNTGQVPLCLIITTMPTWLGADEAEEVAGYWMSE